MAGETRQQRRNWTFRLIVWALVVAILALFIAENFNIVEVRLIVIRVEIRLAWALLLASGLGFVAGLLVPRLRR